MFPAIRFHSYATSTTVFIEMDPRQIKEDREASLAFLGMKPRTFDKTQRAAALAEWLHDMETIFSLCHIEVPFASSGARGDPAGSATEKPKWQGQPLPGQVAAGGDVTRCRSGQARPAADGTFVRKGVAGGARAPRALSFWNALALAGLSGILVGYPANTGRRGTPARWRGLSAD
ncbi:hypothetical protein TIFTF001_048612 [Ficus carica]|uniref:Uncharacterized protein n=1 Tax=Ficus carica TaxID=3494 RepID=A0AA87YWJ5_FICCA|nr:hypothetical protein TIFTF001_048609 [Ficus carica]GMN19430.1 hypothetical protein TIFTF001_048612 [Ficus carica]